MSADACEVLARVVKEQGPDVVTFGANCVPEWANYPWLENALAQKLVYTMTSIRRYCLKSRLLLLLGVLLFDGRS